MKIQINELELNNDELERLTIGIAHHLKMHATFKKNENKRYMNITETAKYMNVSYNTLKSKFIPRGLTSVLIDGIERFDKIDCDRFMNAHKR